ncbi:MAG: Eco57I restriction-modification methylase domain-containing protein, partial [Dysgonamonadaceae bacterium]|nr:Eco57I restriction-modification methylase domain-containing protein [Dysgonamonadaceae bacterium]
MSSNIKSTKQALNPAFLKQKPERKEIDLFKKEFIDLLDRINLKESEEYHKNLIKDFLNSVYYKDKHYINTKGKNDLVIHNEDDTTSSVGVLIEAKSPVNKAEMVSHDNLNVKSFQELVLYYLRERKTGKNFELRYLIITNIYEWFVFDAQDFEKLFYLNKTLLNRFEQFQAGKLSGTSTDFFYKEIASPEIQKLQTEMPYTHFDIRDYEKILRNTDKEDDRKLITLYKFLSPVHLLKLPFANDNNRLNKEFYTELLHIIGLEEIKQDNKKLIARKKENERDSGSIIENAIERIDVKNKLDNLNVEQFGMTKEEQLFGVALDLAITWINRILFLKLLESQIVKYHNGNKNYAFLSPEKLTDYDDLDSLFFSVLARKEYERQANIKVKFTHVPYLNSSLFEITEIEDKTICIDSLQDNIKMALHPKSLLHNHNNKEITPLVKTMRPLDYLLRFLDAYDFSSEGSEEIQEENKTLISASVLGLIFEKINGYKDASFFTPSFITMYMCRETISRAVIQRFNETKKWNCQTINELYNKIENITEANEIFNLIRICDPSVGSGHFLVSALNEMIYLKSELGILSDKNGKKLKDYRVTVENDELIITDNEGNYFAYNPKNVESQRIQETFFHEKQIIIENCLFGVDINPNSAKICRLRLWIELLKHTYYISPLHFREGQGVRLETLPNIDINIKCGNSLINRFDLQGNYAALPSITQQKLQKATQDYKAQVILYKCTNDKATKKLTSENIAQIKATFSQINNPTDIDYRKWKEAEAKSTAHFMSIRFDEDNDVWNKQLELLQAKTDALREKYKQKIKTYYSNAFEWSFEFPEVLDDNGNFIGFDVMIGNPPYMRVQTIRDSYPKLADKYEELYKSATGSYDIYAFFVEKSLSLIKESGIINFIMPVKWTNATFGKGLRSVISTSRAISKIINFGSFQVFDASTYTGLQWFQKKSENLLYFELDKDFKTNEELSFFLNTITNNNFHQIPSSTLTENTWTLSNGTIMSILDKLNKQPRRMSDIFEKIFQGIATSKDNVYFLYDCTADSEYISGYSKQIEETVRIERRLVKPLLKGEDVHRYETIKTNRFVIFPYKLSNNEAVLYTENELRELFPSGFAYLKRCEDVLRGREKG